MSERERLNTIREKKWLGHNLKKWINITTYNCGNVRRKIRTTATIRGSFSSGDRRSSTLPCHSVSEIVCEKNCTRKLCTLSGINCSVIVSISERYELDINLGIFLRKDEHERRSIKSPSGYCSIYAEQSFFDASEHSISFPKKSVIICTMKKGYKYIFV